MVSSRQNDAFALFISARESPTGPLEPGWGQEEGAIVPPDFGGNIEAKSSPLSGLRLLLVPIPRIFRPSYGPVSHSKFYIL